jgi:hypothetical protein
MIKIVREGKKAHKRGKAAATSLSNISIDPPDGRHCRLPRRCQAPPIDTSKVELPLSSHPASFVRFPPSQISWLLPLSAKSDSPSIMYCSIAGIAPLLSPSVTGEGVFPSEYHTAYIYRLTLYLPHRGYRAVLLPTAVETGCLNHPDIWPSPFTAEHSSSSKEKPPCVERNTTAPVASSGNRGGGRRQKVDASNGILAGRGPCIIGALPVHTHAQASPNPQRNPNRGHPPSDHKNDFSG